MSKETEVIEQFGNLIYNFSDSDLDLDQTHQDNNNKLPLDIRYQNTQLSVNRPKQNQLIKLKYKFFLATLTLIRN
jgi:hypothetical protein